VRAQARSSSPTLARQAAFQRHVLGPKSRFSWKGASDALPLALNSGFAPDCGASFMRAFPSPRAQNMPHERTEWASNHRISAPKGPKPGVFPPPNGPSAGYFCTGRLHRRSANENAHSHGSNRAAESHRREPERKRAAESALGADWLERSCALLSCRVAGHTAPVRHEGPNLATRRHMCEGPGALASGASISRTQFALGSGL
jgi:hypothetical protein